MKIISLITCIGLLSLACSSEPQKAEVLKSPVDLIVDSAIAYHGGAIYKNLNISFFFRDREYTAQRKDGMFEYTSVHSDSNGVYTRVLNNEGFTESLNGSKVPHLPKDSISRAGSVNSVLYFALLPGLLNDPGAYKTIDGTDEIDGKAYHRIKVTFDPENGGEDFDDVYFYWFDKEGYRMDYFAYSYTTDEGGTRFRKAMNSRRINGLVFQDYENFKGPGDPDSLRYILNIFKRGELKLLSTIALSRIKVDSAE